MSTYTFTVKHSVIKTLALFAARKDIRYYLNGIAVDLRDPAAPTLVATDGHRLIAVDLLAHDPSVEITQGGVLPKIDVSIIPIDALLKIKPAKVGRTELPLTITLCDPVKITDASTGETVGFDRFTLARIATSPDAAVTCRLVDGRYPDWRRVIPSTEGVRLQAAASLYQVGYLSDMVEALQLLGIVGSKFPGLPLDCACYVPINQWNEEPITSARLLTLQERAMVLPFTKGVHAVLMNKRV